MTSLLILHSGKHGSLSPSPSLGETFMLAKEEGEKSSELKKQAENGNVNIGEQISAADYDPSLDRREDEGKRVLPPAKVEEIEIEEEEEEDDVDDMFAVATSDKKPKVKRVKKVTVRIFVFFVPYLALIFLSQRPSAPALIASTLDSAADSEGYYSVILGEQLDGGRYQVFSSLGKGMFANVVRARVLLPEPNEPSGREVETKECRAPSQVAARVPGADWLTRKMEVYRSGYHLDTVLLSRTVHFHLPRFGV